MNPFIYLRRDDDSHGDDCDESDDEEEEEEEEEGAHLYGPGTPCPRGRALRSKWGDLRGAVDLRTAPTQCRIFQAEREVEV